MDIRLTSRQDFLTRLTLARPSFRGSRLGEFDALEDLVSLVEQANGDLSELSDEQLAELRAALAAGYAAARPTVETDEQVDALAAVAAAVGTVDAETANRTELAARQAAEAEEAAARRAEQLAQMDAAVGGPEDDDADGGDGEGDDDGGAGDGDGDGNGGEEGAAQAAAPPAPAAPNLAALSLLGLGAGTGRADDGDDTADRPASIELAGRITAAASFSDLGLGEAFRDAAHLGEVMARTTQELRVAEPSDRKHYLGRRRVERSHAVLQSEFGGDSTSIIDEAVRRNTARKVAAAVEDARRTAAGGVCVPAMPDYTLTLVGEGGTPFVDSLATVQGNRPLSYWRWINMSLTAAAGSRVGARPNGGIGTVTAAQDAAGYGPTGSVPVGGHAYKDCVRIDCPTPTSEAPEATFRCTTVGNFAAQTWPEYVRLFEQTVGAYFDIYRDERALAKIVAAAKILDGTAGAVFGATRDLLDVMRRLVAHVRSVRHAPNLPFTFVVPGFARQMIASDLAFSWAATADSNLRISPAQALSFLAVDEGITIDEYNVSIGNTGGGVATVLPELTTGGALPEWPSELRILAYPDGGIFRHDYGEIAFGLRETGMQTNDTSGFYEVFESVSTRTTDIFAIDVPVCVSGLQGGTVVKLCGNEPVEE